MATSHSSSGSFDAGKGSKKLAPAFEYESALQRFGKAKVWLSVCVFLIVFGKLTQWTLNVLGAGQDIWIPEDMKHWKAACDPGSQEERKKGWATCVIGFFATPDFLCKCQSNKEESEGLWKTAGPLILSAGGDPVGDDPLKPGGWRDLAPEAVVCPVDRKHVDACSKMKKGEVREEIQLAVWNAQIFWLVLLGVLILLESSCACCALRCCSCCLYFFIIQIFVFIAVYALELFARLTESGSWLQQGTSLHWYIGSFALLTVYILAFIFSIRTLCARCRVSRSRAAFEEWESLLLEEKVCEESLLEKEELELKTLQDSLAKQRKDKDKQLQKIKAEKAAVDAQKKELEYAMNTSSDAALEWKRNAEQKLNEMSQTACAKEEKLAALQRELEENQAKLRELDLVLAKREKASHRRASDRRASDRRGVRDEPKRGGRPQPHREPVGRRGREDEAYYSESYYSDSQGSDPDPRYRGRGR